MIRRTLDGLENGLRIRGIYTPENASKVLETMQDILKGKLDELEDVFELGNNASLKEID